MSFDNLSKRRLTVCGGREEFPVYVAEKYFERARGLLFRDELGKKEGLLIKKCNAVHTFFMGYRLDLIFLSRCNEVVKVYRNVKPWRHRIVLSANSVIELKSGGDFADTILVGDRIEII